MPDTIPTVVDNSGDNSGDSILSTILGDGGLGPVLTGLGSVIGSLNGNIANGNGGGNNKPPSPPAPPKPGIGSFISNPVYMIIGVLVIVGAIIWISKK